MDITKLTSSHEGDVIRLLTDAGYEAYFVGGCVRDAIMGREAGDIDVATSALPQQVEAVFEGRTVIETGIRHGTVTLLYDGEPIEITTFRTEGEYTDRRHPDEVSFVTDIREDLARRDFTMNAIAMGEDGEITDPFGGRRDIEAGLIRAVGDPGERFSEDALRIMRAVRFAAQLGFAIEEETSRAMHEHRGLLADISKERIYAELKKIVAAPHAGEAVMGYTDVLGEVIPHLLQMKGFMQHNPYHRYDVLEHCVRCMDNIRTTPENHVYMKLTGLFHDIGKPDTFTMDEQGIGHFYGHPAVSAEHAEEILKGLRADTFTTERVKLLTKYHDLLFRKDPKLLKKWLRKFEPEVLFELLEIKRADNLATGHVIPELIQRFDEIRVMLEKILADEECFKLKDLLVDGNDIMDECGVSGPAVGEILDGLLTAVIEERIHNEKEPLLEEARRIAKERGASGEQEGNNG